MTDSPIGHLRIGMASRRARCRPDSANSSANSSASVIREVDMSQPMESAARNGVTVGIPTRLHGHVLHAAPRHFPRRVQTLVHLPSTPVDCCPRSPGVPYFFHRQSCSPSENL
ncbi:uncharacterized protein LOC119165774 isoform X1 [Rhipicephalus microplus]|uniref:uncharacterized protein LOC119165774 isoform X1 n=1 Tax=Rhipicephalus microplus TaxID=6941 RepID=UPI003F6CB46C